jgi:hypothetical protein
MLGSGVSQIFGCLSLLRNLSNGEPVPVSVFMKDTTASINAYRFLLATMPVNGVNVRAFDLPGQCVQCIEGRW